MSEQKSCDNVVVLIHNDSAAKTSLAKAKAKRKFIGFSSHRFNLAMRDILKRVLRCDAARAKAKEIYEHLLQLDDVEIDESTPNYRLYGYIEKLMVRLADLDSVLAGNMSLSPDEKRSQTSLQLFMSTDDEIDEERQLSFEELALKLCRFAPHEKNNYIGLCFLLPTRSERLFYNTVKYTTDHQQSLTQTNLESKMLYKGTESI
eukprot:IDg9766t1